MAEQPMPADWETKMAEKMDELKHSLEARFSRIEEKIDQNEAAADPADFGEAAGYEMLEDVERVVSNLAAITDTLKERLAKCEKKKKKCNGSSKHCTTHTCDHCHCCHKHCRCNHWHNWRNCWCRHDGC